MTERLELADIQGLVLRGYGNLPAACYVLIEIADPAAARDWLRSLIGDITTGSSRPRGSALNVAFTYAGLTKLGLPAPALAMFSLEFMDGMVGPHRSRILGDVAESAAEYWGWGGPGTSSIDAVLLLFGADDRSLEEVYAAHQMRMQEGGGVRELKRLDTTNIGLKEHFGFRDGISQPTIDGSGRFDAAINTIQPGEFMLGYVNEHGQVADGPTFASSDDPRRILPISPSDSARSDYGRNGSYLVFRQLQQDVRAFWRFADDATRNPDGISNEASRTRLAAKMVGRWPSGAPLVKSPDVDDPSLGNDNDFRYALEDPYGYACPVGAHIRRGNPRDSLEPGPGTSQSIAVSKHHRLVRRGREYGQPVDPKTLFAEAPSRVDDVDRGLQFICLCGNIARQFEFVQHSWLMNTRFSGLYDECDPVMGAPLPARGPFTIQAPPLRQRVSGLSRFVTVRGGAYFFMPGLRATRFLAESKAGDRVV